MESLTVLLERSADLHRHLCPRQVLGVRMGLLAGEILGLDLPQGEKAKRLFAIVETDGCASDGIAVAANCWVGHRTMKIEDYGKVAATFVDTRTKTSVRIIPRREIRSLAHSYAPEADNKWEAQLLGYQRIPNGELLSVSFVQLATPIEMIISRPGMKAVCDQCGEEIMNQREIRNGGLTLCRACAGSSYYSEILVTAHFPAPMEVIHAT